MTSTRSGGAGTNYGLLYQVLSSLHRALAISTSSEMITLTVEPPGGDLVETTSRTRHVFQYKAKATRGALSMNFIADHVFPDLYRAVPEVDDGQSRYWLVTEGHSGRWTEAEELFQKLGDVPANTLPDILDDGHAKPFYPSRQLTDRQFFIDLVQRMAKTPDPDAQAYRRAQILLTHFDFRTESLTSVRAAVMDALLGYVPHQEKVHRVAHEMMGLLLEWGAEGNRIFETEELLRAVGLSTASLTLLPFATQRMRERLFGQLRRAGYDAEKHVARPVNWPPDRSLLCLAGESGTGKTLLLAQVADTASRSGMVVFVRPRGSVQDALAAAANEVWRETLGNDEVLPLETLAKRAHRVKLGMPWLTVCVDLTANDTQTMEVLEYPWTDWGVRVAFTAEAKTADALRERESEIVIHAVADFTVDQLNVFFSKHQIDRRSIPPFLIDPLRRPMLASIYAQIDDVGAWRDTNEYTLFRTFWRRLETASGQTEHPNDTGALLRLADATIDDWSCHPWQASLIRDLEVDDGTRVRLQRLGWLRNVENGAAEIPHDRLLNWAIAEAIVDRVRRKKWTCEDAGAYLQNILRQFGGDFRRFAFIPMDTLAIAAANVTPGELAAILGVAERSTPHFYDSLLPTIGNAIVPALVARLRLNASRRYQIRSSLLGIDAHEPLGRTQALAWLDDTHIDVQRIGIELLRRHPCADALDRLWRIRSERLRMPEDDHMTRHSELEAVNAALDACVLHDPSWIRRKMQSAEDPDLARLAKLLAVVTDKRGAAVWQTTKDAVLHKAENDDVARATAACIGAFRDTAEVVRLCAWISDRPRIADIAFAALACIDPNLALDALSSIEDIDSIVHTANRWLGCLLTADRQRTTKIIDGRLRAGDFRVGGWYFWVLGRDPLLVSDLTESFWNRLLAVLEEPDVNKREIDRIVAMLAMSTTVESIAFLEALASDRSAQKFGMYVAERVAKSDHTPDQFVEAAGILLRKIGGAPLQTFLFANLDREDHGWIPDKIRDFLCAPSVEAELRVRDRLCNLWPLTRDPHDPMWPERTACIEMLVATGDRSVALRAAEEGALSITDTLTGSLLELPPASDTEVAPLFARVDESSDVKALHALGVSGRSDAVPPVVTALLEGSNERTKAAAEAALRYYLVHASSVNDLNPIRDAGEHGLYRELLLKRGGKDAFDAAADDIIGHPTAALSEDSVHLIAWLAVFRKDVRLADIVWDWAKAHHPFFWRDSDTIWEAIGFVDGSETKEFLSGAAFSDDPNPSAIRGLARSDSNAAFEAAQRLLLGGSRARAAAPDLLIEINAASAVTFLFSHLPRERNALVQIATCIALRDHLKTTDAIGHITTLLSDSDAAKRAAGCQIAGWSGIGAFTDELRTIALDDQSPFVSAFAFDALACLESQERAAALLGSLGSLNGTVAWATVDAVVQNGPVFLLNRSGDPLAIRPSLRSKPAALRTYAAERLDKAVTEQSKRLDTDISSDAGRW